MASSNNSKIISVAHPHTIKKFQLIEEYIKTWADILLLSSKCNGVIFIDCMCNSGIYKNDDGETVYGTPIRVSNLLLEAARKYPDKQIHIYLNDNNAQKIELLSKHLPVNERNYQIITTVLDGNELLKEIGSQLYGPNHMHYFLLYDPYDASIDWNALTPFFRNWGEVLINHMVSDSIRAVSQVKREQAKQKYTGTYQVDDISDLVPYGKDRAAYEKRVLEIINSLKGSSLRQYFVSAFPFFNTRNSLVYDLIHCTGHIRGFKLFKSTAWKAFDGYSSSKTTHDLEGQMTLDCFGEDTNTTTADETRYTLKDAAQYLQINFHGRADVPKQEVWQFLDLHPVFISEGFARTICDNLTLYYGAKVSRSTITFSDRRG